MCAQATGPAPRSPGALPLAVSMDAWREPEEEVSDAGGISSHHRRHAGSWIIASPVGTAGDLVGLPVAPSTGAPGSSR